MRRLSSSQAQVAATALTIALLLGVAPAVADVSIQSEGRQTRTGPKQPQSEFNGVLLLDVSPDALDRPSGRRLTATGRSLRSQPTLRVSVGIIGCPGCTEALRSLGGILVDERGANPRGYRLRRGR